MFNWRRKALKVFNKEKSEKETEHDFAEELINAYNKMKIKEEKDLYHTNEQLFLIREGDNWNGRKCSEYSYKDFNEYEDFKRYLGTNTRFQLLYRYKGNEDTNNVISEAALLVRRDEDKYYDLEFGWITSKNKVSQKSFGGMTFLVASIIYIFLNDEGLKDTNIKISLEMHSEARSILEQKNIDVYHNIFDTKKDNNNKKDLYRECIFTPENREKDIARILNVLNEKELKILETLENYLNE